MTDEQRIAFIKDKIAPLFDGMNAEDALEILQHAYNLELAVFSRLTLSLGQKSDQ